MTGIFKFSLYQKGRKSQPRPLEEKKSYYDPDGIRLSIPSDLSFNIKRSKAAPRNVPVYPLLNSLRFSIHRGVLLLPCIQSYSKASKLRYALQRKIRPYFPYLRVGNNNRSSMVVDH
ncbi:hypothetical protein ACMFMG_004838 [Clarireedia jacksonii]